MRFSYLGDFPQASPAHFLTPCSLSCLHLLLKLFFSPVSPKPQKPVFLFILFLFCLVVCCFCPNFRDLSFVFSVMGSLLSSWNSFLFYFSATVLSCCPLPFPWRLPRVLSLCCLTVGFPRHSLLLGVFLLSFKSECAPCWILPMIAQRTSFSVSPFFLIIPSFPHWHQLSILSPRIGCWTIFDLQEICAECPLVVLGCRLSIGELRVWRMRWGHHVTRAAVNRCICSGSPVMGGRGRWHSITYQVPFPALGFSRR